MPRKSPAAAPPTPCFGSTALFQAVPITPSSSPHSPADRAHCDCSSAAPCTTNRPTPPWIPLRHRFRGRDAGCPAPPAQIRTCALTHTAPTFGSDRGPLGPPYPLGRLCHGSPTRCSARALASRIPVGHRPWLRQLRSGSLPPCSLPSSLLCRCQTSSDRASSATAVCLPDAVPPIARWDDPKTSQVPAWGVRACLGSQTPRSPTAPRHSGAPDVAFDHEKSLGTSDHIIFDAQYPAHTRRYRRFTGTLTDTAARLAVNRGSAQPSFRGTFTLTPPPVSLAHSHPDCRATARAMLHSKS